MTKLRILFFLASLAVFFNVLQLAVNGNFRLISDENMLKTFKAEYESGFDKFAFGAQCIRQFELSKEWIEAALANGEISKTFMPVTKFADDEPIFDNSLTFSGIWPVYFAEIMVLFLVVLVCAVTIWGKHDKNPSAIQYAIGFLLSYAILIADQLSYLSRSIFVKGQKPLNTWSSYCFHGDLGWAFDVAGYICMYSCLGLGIAIFLRNFHAIYKIKSINDLTKIENVLSLTMVCRVFTWLPYFSYLGFAIWVTATQFNEYAVAFYRDIVFIVMGILIFIFALCAIALSMIYVRYDGWASAEAQTTQEKIQTNPVGDLLDPFGTKAFTTFIRIILPPLTMLAFSSDVLRTFVGFAV